MSQTSPPSPKNLKPNVSAPLPFDEAKRVLEQELKKFTSQQSGTAENTVLRLEVPVEPVDLFDWLSNPDSNCKIYFSGRDPEDIEIAGIGLADCIASGSGTDVLDYSTVFQHMRRILSSSSPNLRYYGGCAFAPGHIDHDWDSFGTCRFIIPRFEIFVRNQHSSLACNFLSNKSNVNAIISQLNNLTANSFDTTNTTSTFSQNTILHRKDLPHYDAWKDNLSHVLADIRAQKLSKTVLARKVNLEFLHPVNPVNLLRQLKKLPTGRYGFLFQLDGKTTFLGSSPERLYKRTGYKVKSEAVAGTRTRGQAEQDDLLLANELMNSDKEQREHDFVVDSIKDGLRSLCTSLDTDSPKGLLKLKEGQHLVSLMEGTLKDNVSDEMLLEILHPTPAVGGCPLDKALETIDSCEPFKRGWYAGVIGTVGHNSSDFAVGLRSGLTQGNRLSLFSGVGIVDGSDPDAEWKEVETKITNFLDIIQ
jgi:menaquinone-specific isochorismate synthase